MRNQFKMERSESLLAAWRPVKFLAVVISILLMLFAISSGAVHGQDEVSAEFNIIRLEDEGFIEVVIALRTEPIELADAEVGLEGPYEDSTPSNSILLKDRENPAEKIEILWKIEESVFEEMFPNGDYKYIIDYGNGDELECPFVIAGDFPQRPTFVSPQHRDTVPPSFSVSWEGEFDDGAMDPMYLLKFESEGEYRGAKDTYLAQAFSPETNEYRVLGGLFGRGMYVEVILTATQTVDVQDGNGVSSRVMKGSHIDMLVRILETIDWSTF